MSYVAFHSPSGRAQVLGSERAFASGLINDMALGLITPRDQHDVDQLLELIPAGHYLRQRPQSPLLLPQWVSRFQMTWSVELPLSWGNRRFDAWTCSLNTALALGNDPVRFLARLEAQCEMHCWVDGPDRDWLAGLIEEGRRLGVYRAAAGWEEAVTLLRSRADEPVVLSHSSGEGFPSISASDWEPPPLAGQDDELDWDAWYEIPDAEQWEICMAWLRRQPGRLQLTPDGWSEYHFSHGLTVFDLTAPDYAERLTRALGA